MKLTFLLDGANPKLSKAEVFALLGVKKGILKGKILHLKENTELDFLRFACERSSLIKKCESEDPYFYWRAENGRFLEREPQKKPAFHPTLLKPKLARTLVNLSDLKKGQSLLDPFCGLGSILLEAAILGIKVTGSDLSDKAIAGSKKNLGHYNQNGKIIKCDASKLDCFKEKFDAIITDPPYGVLSRVHADDTKKLYVDFLNASLRVLKSNGKLVMMYPDKIKLRRKIPKSYKVENQFDIYVHRHLTRKLLVLKRIK